MGARGPRPTPTAILESRGSRAVKKRKNEPVPTGDVKCPAWLPAEAKKVWKIVVKHLEPMNILGSVDTNALARYCVLFAKWQACEKFIAENGMVRETVVKGQLTYVRYPQAGIADKLSEQLTRLEREFGMTPASRVNMISTKPAEQEEHGIAALVRPRLVG